MAITYFGQTTTSASFTYTASGSKGNVNLVFTCPDTGNQILKELSLYCKSNGGTPGNIRIAIYDTASPGNLIAQGDAEVSVSSTTAGWVGHTTFTGTTTLTGGTNYRLVFTTDSSDSYWSYVAGTSGDYRYEYVDRTGGFGATLDIDGMISASSTRTAIRAGVEPEAGGTAFFNFFDCGIFRGIMRGLRCL